MVFKGVRTDVADRRWAGRYRVADAVIGGGFDLRAGEIVESVTLGPYAHALLAAGAVARIADDVRLVSI